MFGSLSGTFTSVFRLKKSKEEKLEKEKRLVRSGKRK